MSDPIGSGRRFGDKDVALILKRAAELQHRDPLAVREGAGFTLAELESVAQEAGIDPKYVRRAVDELGAQRGSPAIVDLIGAPVALDFTRAVSREAPNEAFDALVAEIQAGLNEIGAASALGRSLVWHSGNVQRQLQVSVTPRGGQTEIRAHEKLGNLAGGLFGGIVGGIGGGGIGVAMGVGMGALGAPPLVAVGAAVAIVAGAYALARGIYVAEVRRRSDSLRRLVDRLAERVGAGYEADSEG